MADAIGLIASLLALIATTIEGIKLAKTLYRAPEELISVQVRIYGSLRRLQIHIFSRV